MSVLSQLSGGNYYCSVLQFLQAEKTIRLRSLVKSGYNLKKISEIFQASNTNRNHLLKEQSILFADLLQNFNFAEHTSDIPVTYYVAGYVSRRLLKASKCQACQLLFSDKNQPLSIEFEENSVVAAESEAGVTFLNAISRGGLVKPSNLLFITCMHASDLYQYIREDEKLLSELLNSENAQTLFIETFLCKLEEVEETNSILKVSCSKGHLFKDYVRHAAATMFNLFAKNLVAEYNNEIHRDRKRNGNNLLEEQKRDLSLMKQKKLKSQ